ncbi:hypothetical protein [Pedobacter nutrimenti]|uniref:hypothetical protein n=1 Tax=Pedobacter nutrimenti TaxID=1241337 RepID=UPI00293053E7|nr:hypothetical protein [Pedobacter nutrimenti]
MAIEELMEKLHGMFPITVPFRTELKEVMYTENADKLEVLLKAGTGVWLAWYLEEGLVEGKVERNGIKMVERFYKSGEIFTDMDGFFEGKKALLEFTTITTCKLWVLTRAHYIELEKYKETHRLKDAMMLLEKRIDAERAYMMTLQVKERFAYFAKLYPFLELPNKLCASFLNMYESNYSKYKADYLRNL